MYIPFVSADVTCVVLVVQTVSAAPPVRVVNVAAVVFAPGQIQSVLHERTSKI